MAEKKDILKDRVMQLGSNKFELVDFRLYEFADNDEIKNEPIYEGIYGINIAKVREINKITQFTKLPNTHNCIEGVLELRDEAIPIINLAKFLGYKNNIFSSTDNIIICEFNNYITGFIVHKALKIRRISWDKILPPIKLTGKEGGSVTGMYKIETEINERMLLILDFEKIVAEINGDTLLINRFEEEKANNHWSAASDDSKTILVVDDSNTARAQTEMYLSKEGYRVFTANDGEDALNLLEKLYDEALSKKLEIYDILQIIISDVEMPRVDGYAFSQKVKNDNRFSMMPIIMNTSLSGRSNLTRGKNCADDYIVKFDPEKLKIACDKQIKTLEENRHKILLNRKVS